MTKLQKKYIKMARSRLSTKQWRKQGLKLAWKLQRGGSSRKAPSPSKSSRKPRKGGTHTASNHKPPGMFAKLNAALRAVKIGLPALRSFTAGLSFGAAAKDAASRYTGFDFNAMKFDTGKATVTAGFYAGNLIERKALSALKIPQMAGRKKLLAIGGQYLPEIIAVGELQANMPLQGVGSRYGQRSIGYANTQHASWLENPGVRGRFFRNLAARIALGLASRFVGPMVNPHLPKGINI